MKNKLLILLLILIPGGMIFSIEADTLWRADLESSINDYKISPDDSRVLVHRDGAFEMLDSDNGENLWTLPISSTGHFFFLPQNSNQIIALKSLSEYYLIDANIGSVIDTIRIDEGLEVTPYSVDISFDGKYLVGTYRTKVGEVKYSNGEVKTHAYYKMHIVDLENNRVHYDGYELISSSLIEMGNFDYSLIRSSFNASTIEYNLYKFIVTQEGISSEINNIVSCDCNFPGFSDIEMLKNENAIGIIDLKGKIKKISLDNNNVSQIFSPFVSGFSNILISFSFDGKNIVTSSNPDVVIDINNESFRKISESNGFGFYNLKFDNSNLGIYMERTNSLYLVTYDFLTNIEINYDNEQIIYPNPTNDKIHLNFFNDFASIFKYSIYNINSELIIQNEIGYLTQGQNKVSIDISALPSGSFYLSVFSDQEMFKYSFIKEK